MINKVNRKLVIVSIDECLKITGRIASYTSQVLNF